MAFLEQHIIWRKEEVIKQNEKTSVSFNTKSFLEGRAEDYRLKLRIRGDVGLHPSWMYEGGIPYLYRDINDSLSTDTHHSQFCLKIQANGEEWPRRAYYKIVCPPKINTQYPVPEGSEIWYFKCLARAVNLKLWKEEERTDGTDSGKAGKARIKFECFAKKEGIDPRDISAEPIETVCMEFPEGSYDWSEFSCVVPLGEETAAVLVTIELDKAEGVLFLEDPELKNDAGFNILPPLEPANRYHECFNWYGENLSHKEWMDLQITVNGKNLPEFAFFHRCYRGSESEIELPAGSVKDGENLIEIENVSDYFHPLPFQIQQISILAEKKAPVRIAWCPEIVDRKEFGILLKTYAPDIRITIFSEGLEGERSLYCKEPGLHILRMKPLNEAGEAGISVSAEGYTESARIDKIVEREEDGVLAGSGDAIYIPQEIGELEDFLIWYLENNLGNMLTFRPVYRWTGTRECNEAFWHRVRELCQGLNLFYCHIIDGRELPGINANPASEMLAGPFYLGHQGHERDGLMYYWVQRRHPTNDIFYMELSNRISNNKDCRYPIPIEYYKGETYIGFNSVMPRDMKEAADQFVKNASIILKGASRHSGPSTLFKYFFQAGISLCSAELMYGPLEVVLAALRGASFAYDRDRFGAHLAVQWGTTPHDTEERYRRYQLALFVCYLQGVHHINTEEGLYRMEEMFAVLDRFSLPCRRHGEIERNFVRFVKTHSRKGRMHRGIALLHGAYDGWACFCRREIWAQEGEKWKFDTPEESWDLIKVFYPDSVLDAIYRHPCPNAPQGYYTRTPYGTVDILPIEADEEKMRHYGAMAFLGWNTADEGQLERLKTYVKNGGVLLLGWPHLFTDTDREEVLWGTPHPIDASELTGISLKGFSEKKEGKPTIGIITIAEGTEIVKTYFDDTDKKERPLLLKRNLGKGFVYFVNAAEYPAHPSVRGVYEDMLQMLGQREINMQKEKGVLISEDTVETAIYDREDGYRDIYAINTDWYSAKKDEASARLFVGSREYPVRISRGCMHIFTISPDGKVSALKDPV